MFDPLWLCYPALLYPLWEAANVRLQTYALSFPQLLPEWDGLRLLFLSDSHTLRRGRRERHLARLLDGIETDLLLFGGDIAVDREGYDVLLKIVEGVTVTTGRYAIWGNSENLKKVPTNAIQARLQEAGFQLLNNRSSILRRKGSPLAICGVDCPYSRKADFSAAFEGIPDETFQVLLMHAPEGLLKLDAYHPDLILSGHTHGGQIRLPGLPAFHLHTKTHVKLDWGKFGSEELRPYWQDVPDTTQLLIGTGIGTSTLPVRTFCPPEVLSVTLHRSLA